MATGTTTRTDPRSEHDVETLRRRLAAVGQEHLLNFYDELDTAAQTRLLAQINELDLERLPSLIEGYVKNKPAFALPGDVAPAPYYPADATSPVRAWDRDRYDQVGADLLAGGKVAAFTVAGGQGSRLGYDGPKGCFPAGAVTGKPLFAFFAEGLLGVGDRFGVTPAWYIMTSPLNHDATVAFFEEHNYFGLKNDDVMFFPQGVLPSLDIKTGKVLLAGKGEVATNPDGHGGSLKALWHSGWEGGAIADMKRRGVEHISYFQVDNPIVRVMDPVFIGLHAAAPDSSGEMSSKMIPKAYADEKLGLFCSTKGKTVVIEYSDLPKELQHQTLPDGSLRFLAGSIAIHMIGVRFVERLNTEEGFSLEYHRAEKKIPCIDPATGEPITPTANNGVKLEQFVFDALPKAEKSIVLETVREEEFAPIKNGGGGVDSVESSQALQTLRAARWLEAAGVKVAAKPDGTPDCVIELSPRAAMFPCDLKEHPDTLPKAIGPGERVAL